MFNPPTQKRKVVSPHTSPKRMKARSKEVGNNVVDRYYRVPSEIFLPGSLESADSHDTMDTTFVAKEKVTTIRQRFIHIKKMARTNLNNMNPIQIEEITPNDMETIN